MPGFNYESTIQAPAALVFDWHHDPTTLEKLTPPWEPVTVVGTPGRIDENGSRTTLKISMLGFIPLYWVAEHRNYQPGQSFQDVQIRGPFARWCHTHSVEPIDEHSCRYIDSVEYKVPIGWVGELFGGRLVRQKLNKMFVYRHQVVKEECEGLAAANSDGSAA
ncbi:MAG: SRPBCC family protein [Deltaproteobacteria bacterium]|nr:SRPBCC family protein [Deltaproteobacteria bacterium]MCW9050342.1 SRPBCC family protein [Deltaproteobacteria bacterium]